MLKRLFTSSLAIALLSVTFSFALPQVSYASVAGSKQAACESVSLNGADCGATESTNKVNSLVSTIVNVLSLIVGIVAVFMIIIAGFKYVTSGGESSNVSGAKNTLVYAIIGIVIVALAQFIIRFVIGTTNNLS